MKYYVFFTLASLCVLVGYSNCGQVGETGLTSSTSLQTGDPAQGAMIYNIDGTKPACITCHAADGTGVLGVDLKTFSDEDIETAIRTGPAGMTFYNTTDISEQQLLHLLAYIRTL
jgi:mono/diheme cytochrome c family protein